MRHICWTVVPAVPRDRRKGGEEGGLVGVLLLGRGLALPLPTSPASQPHSLGGVRRLLQYLIRRIVAVPKKTKQYENRGKTRENLTFLQFTSEFIKNMLISS